MICNICCNQKINTCLISCGHTFCLKCVEKMNNKCAMCRNTFSSKIKMFIDDMESEDENEDDNNNNNNEIEGHRPTSFSFFSGIFSSTSTSRVPMDYPNPYEIIN